MGYGDVRIALSRQILNNYVDERNVLAVITVDPEIENLVRSAIYEDPLEGRILGLDPDTSSTVLGSMIDAFKKAGLDPERFRPTTAPAACPQTTETFSLDFANRL